MIKTIKEVTIIVSDKIESKLLTPITYISTENMLPNFGGITESSISFKGKCTSFKKNDIILSNIRPYFKKLWYSTFDGGCSNDCIVLRTNNDCVESKFLYYCLCNDNFFSHYVASSKGTKMPRGDKESLLKWKINIPSIVKQQHIVDIVR